MILADPNPVLSLAYLINEATIDDVYAALDTIEFRTYLRLEAEALNDNED